MIPVTKAKELERKHSVERLDDPVFGPILAELACDGVYNDLVGARGEEWSV